LTYEPDGQNSQKKGQAVTAAGKHIAKQTDQRGKYHNASGQQYLNEAGYQHFGLIMSICAKKALVIPMTSNASTYAKAYDPKNNPRGKKNLMRIGKVEGLNKESVLFLNDIRYVNTARVIDIKAHIPTDSSLFVTAQKRMMEVMFMNDIDE
jgi:hypothetical protein